MNDGFNWFVAAAIALRFILGLIAGVLFRSYALEIGLVVAIAAVISYIKFIYTPVRWVGRRRGRMNDRARC